MSDLKDQAIEVLQGLITTAVQTGEFLKEQLPLVVQELLVFSTYKYGLLSLLALIALITAITIVIIARRRGDSLKKAGCCGGDWYLTAVCTLVFAVPPAFISTCIYITNLLKVTLAPRVWLIEYAADLVR